MRRYNVPPDPGVNLVDSGTGTANNRSTWSRRPTAVCREPAQLAASITFLLSDDGTNLTGVIMPSDGGWSVQ